MGANPLLINERPVFALKVNQHKPVTHRVNLGMMAGYSQVFDDYIIISLPADGQGIALLHGIILKRFIFKS